MIVVLLGLRLRSSRATWRRSFVRILPLARKLLRLIRWSLILNFRDNFFFWGGTPEALGSLGQSLARIKISGRSTPKWPKCSFQKNIYVGWSIWANRTVLLVDQSSPKFFRPTWKGLWLIKYFWDVRYVDPFRRYSRCKLKVVRNRAEIWTFFWLSEIFGAGLPKVVHALSSLPRGTSSGKFYSH